MACSSTRCDFPGVDFDYSRHAMEIFRAETRPQLSADERARLDEVEAIDPFGYAEEFPERWRAFRQSRLTNLVSRLRRALTEVSSTLVVSAGVPSDPSNALAESFQDWTNWMETGLVDGVGRRSGTSGTIVFTPDAFSATTLDADGVALRRRHATFCSRRSRIGPFPPPPSRSAIRISRYGAKPLDA